MQRLNEYCYLTDGALQCTLVVLNIDRFKLFNQSQGLLAGDQLLVAFAGLLREALGARAELMRLGGDEFAVIDAGGASVREIGARLRAACARPVRLAGGEYVVDASMGVAIFPTTRSTPKRCCAPPTPPCTRPSASPAPRWRWPNGATRNCPAWRWKTSRRCARASATTSCISITSPRSTPPAASCWASRRWRAGSGPASGWSARWSSSRLPSAPA
jgi:diguanylate cyclase (GGDEF)-like protein